MPLLIFDESAGRRRSPIRHPDGSPPPPSGCRWCGMSVTVHGVRWSAAATSHRWTAPTPAQVLARVRAHTAHGTLTAAPAAAPGDDIESHPGPRSTT
ncbi:hypothetical protein ACIQGT_14220 [Streptomyces sp. NPDC093108]|uniref:hypothetical protein n=1 Tax=Streptomyces sp. NPDC093108 TaxID=3366030 RepID=UPI0037F854EE